MRKRRTCESGAMLGSDEVDWLKFENKYKYEGYRIVCGIDEAGRGPLAGPVCAGAVILKDGDMISGVDDSKKLKPKRREELSKIIKERAYAYAIAYASEEEIKNLNILGATYAAMKRAVEKLDIKPSLVLVDGNSTPDFGIPARSIVKGDSLSMSIACASILAKVERDKYMANLSKMYPSYGFDKHKGYGTKLHIQKIKEHGPCSVHRLSFLKNILEDNYANSKEAR